jgi:phosphoglycerol transferase MdoB-like AlkP superfamily enzyme
MIFSGLCALHCSIIPLIVLLGLGGSLSWMMSHEVELFFFVVSLSIAALSLIFSYFKHRKASVIFIALIGFILFIIGHEYLTLTPKTILTSTGGLCILLAHYLNLRFQTHCFTFAIKQ